MYKKANYDLERKTTKLPASDDLSATHTLSRMTIPSALDEELPTRDSFYAIPRSF